MFQDKEVKSVDGLAEEYLDLFRDEKYLELTNRLKEATPETVVAFCRLVAKYENVAQLDFIRRLLSN